MEEDKSKVQEISLDEAKTIDTKQVAYLTLTDGTVVIVKPKDEINKDNIIKEKKIIEIETTETKQGDIKQESPKIEQNEEEQKKEIKKEEELNNTEDINTNNQQIKNENQEEEENKKNIEKNIEQENYINQEDVGEEMIEENYDGIENYQQPQGIQCTEDIDNEGGKILSYGGKIEERRNYIFYASGIGYIEPKKQEQQLLEERRINQDNQEYIQEQIDDEYNEQEQRICNCCGRLCDNNRQICEYCSNHNINGYNYINTYQVSNSNRGYNSDYQEIVRKDGQFYALVPVNFDNGDNLEYVIDDNVYEKYPIEYRNDGRYIIEREPVYLPEGEYIVEEEILDDNNYDNRGYYDYGNRVYYDDYNGEYYQYVDEPRCMCPVENVRNREYVREKRFTRDNYPKFKNKNYYKNQVYKKVRVNTRRSDEDQK